MASTTKRRLAHILDTLATPAETVGTLTLGTLPMTFPSYDLLDVNDPVNIDNLHFMLQKYLLGQDIFLVGQPGPYARRLALTFASIINSEYEYIALHRDVGETELKQGREIRSGGNLVYVDSPAVNAVKHGRILILEGIEKAERGIMPVLNNLLENREMNLDDGTHIIHPHRFAQLAASTDDSGNLFIPAHKNFRVVAIAAPVPPFPGHPLDPPFRSRFQARFVDPVGAFLALCPPPSVPETELESRLRELVLSTQYASEARDALSAVSKSALPPFPQTALQKLRVLATAFPPPDADALSPSQLGRLMVVLNPALVYAPMQAWAILSRQTEETGLGALGSPVSPDDEDGQGAGLLGYSLASIARVTPTSATAVFTHPSGSLPDVSLAVPAGPAPLRPFPFSSSSSSPSAQISVYSSPPFTPSPRFVGLLTVLVQAHTLGWDVSLVPPAAPATASSSTSTLVRVFGEILGYTGGNAEAVHMYKELGGRELFMRRRILDGGATAWEPSAIVEAAWAGKLVHLSGLDVIGPTAGALARLVQDRETELWAGKRIVGEATPTEIDSGASTLSLAHPSFRLIATASKSLPLKDWLSAEHANMFFPVPAQPMGRVEEEAILLATGCAPRAVKRMLAFAERYRASMSEDSVQKNRKLGTRSLVRVARRMAVGDLRAVLSRTLLLEFLPAVERMNVEQLFDEAGILRVTPAHNPSPFVQGDALVFPGPSTSGGPSYATRVPLFNVAEDTLGVKSHVPYMDHFYDNSLQTELMRDLAVDSELLGEHVVLLGNQGVGKNKIVDRSSARPREYIQLHRDTTVNQLMFTTSLENGVIKYTDSPLLRAIAFGRVIIIDEADKAPEHVVAIFRSLAGQSELSLSDGRRVRATKERPSDIAVHPNFRLVLLANRPGYPFLGNHFLQVLGETFSAHSVTNPDQESERTLLAQLAPEINEDLILRLVGAFHDLRKGYDAGTLNYPYSLRELINLVKHLQAYPGDSLGDALRNVFDFDVYKPETIEQLAAILAHHGLASHAPHLGLAAAREAAKKKIQDAKFEPKNTELGEPKEGDHDDKEHSGGNKWAGGTGGRDTAGLGGRGGYKRLYKGGNIKQVSDELKQQVPDHVREKAREMARQELQRRLEELDMSVSQAAGYGELLNATEAHMVSLYDLLEHLAAKEEERVWVKRQTDGELDDSRLTEGLTGEATVYKRRGMEKPELGRPQIKPKRIRFVFDLSASMYRFQYDGRLQRSMETAVMLMETFDRLSRKEKYVWDMYAHSGDGADISLVDALKPPADMKDRWKVVEKMSMIPQYAFAGDYTVEAIEKGVKDVGAFDADDWFVIAITDANFGRYLIKPEDISRAMRRDPKVHTALICIGEGAEATWIPKSIPGRGYRVGNTADIPTVLRSILSTMVDR
ncbi:AAA domain-containing protein [Mycena olivaceomarginata]|nr:AAA domain-containing protein [Mycena olivaceomarginata]